MVARAWATFWEHTRFAISSDPSTVLNAPQLTLTGWWTSNASSSKKASLIPQAWVRHRISELEVPLEIHNLNDTILQWNKQRQGRLLARLHRTRTPGPTLASPQYTETFISKWFVSCNWKKEGDQFVMSAKCQVMGIQTCRRNGSRSLWRHGLGKLGSTLEAMRGRTVSEDPGLAQGRASGKAWGRNELISIIASKYTPPILRGRRDDPKYLDKSRKKSLNYYKNVWSCGLGV